MPVSVKKITLWRTEVENKAGALAQVLAPLAGLGVDLQVIMGYRIPGKGDNAIVELFPITGKKASSAAQAAGFTSTAIPTLLVQGDNRPGLGHVIAEAVAAGGMNINFMIAQVVGETYSAVLGLDSEDDAKKVAGIIRKATAKK